MLAAGHLEQREVSKEVVVAECGAVIETAMSEFGLVVWLSQKL